MQKNRYIQDMDSDDRNLIHIAVSKLYFATAFFATRFQIRQYKKFFFLKTKALAARYNKQTDRKGGG